METNIWSTFHLCLLKAGLHSPKYVQMREIGIICVCQQHLFFNN